MKKYFIFTLITFFSAHLFSQENKEITKNVPVEVSNAFMAKIPDAKLSSWETLNNIYTAYFTSDEQQGIAEFSADGKWLFTKYTISEKELPGTIINDIRDNYKFFKIKISQRVLEPEKDYYYYIFIKKSGMGSSSAELYYSFSGKLIKKIMGDDKKINNDTENTDIEKKSSKTDESKKDDINNSQSTKTIKEKDDNKKSDLKISQDDAIADNSIESISSKELPSSVISYIKQNYKNASIKESIISTSDQGTFYSVKIKKEGQKSLIELMFDFKGEFIEVKSE